MLSKLVANLLRSSGSYRISDTADRSRTTARVVEDALVVESIVSDGDWRSFVAFTMVDSSCETTQLPCAKKLRSFRPFCLIRN
jgi:hypothetical protein